MALEFIDLKRNDDVSSLQIDPESLIVLGNLPHNARIAPRDPAAARRWIAWLEQWLEAHSE